VALCTIGQVELAVSLLTDLWPDDDVTPPSAIRIVEFTLEHDLDYVSREAASALERNAARLFDGTGFISWPRQFDAKWDVSAHREVKASITRALIKSWISNPLSSRDQINANPDIVMLYAAFNDQSMSHPFKVSFALALDSAIRAVHPKPDAGIWFPIDEETVQLDDMRTEITDFLKTARRKDEPDFIRSIGVLLNHVDTDWLNRLIKIEGGETQSD